MDEWKLFTSNLPSWGRIGLFATIWIGLWLPIAAIVARRIEWRPFAPLASAQKLPLLAPLYLLVLPLLWADLRLQDRGWQDYGLNLDLDKLPHGWMLLGWGILLSISGLTIVFGIEILTGLARYWDDRRSQLLAPAIPILLLALWISATEELIFRGWLIVELGQDYPWWLSAIVSNIIFALLHLVWERTETWPQIPGLWLMGMVLSYACWLSDGQLWLAIGLHAGWIWGLTAIDTAKLITPAPDSDWFTGIYKQPLAGWGGIGCLALTFLVMWLTH
jgi:uncharacterized protein